MPPTEILTVRDVATYLRLHPMTVYKLTRDHQLPARKVGGQWRFSRTWLEAWITGHKELT